MKKKMTKEEEIDWFNKHAKALTKPIETAFRRNPETGKIEEERWR